MATGNPPQTEKVWLSEEEKAVLIQCRRQSILRGVPMGILSVLGLRFFLKTGRAPSFIARRSMLFSVVTFGGGFMSGVTSYKKTCMEKIMNLENSFLADQVRKQMKKEGVPIPEKWRPKESMNKADRKLTENIIDNNEYSNDLPKVETSLGDIANDDQPVAFSAPSVTDTTSGSKEGRTFDELREENRRRQIDKKFPRNQNRSNTNNNEYKDKNAKNETNTFGRGRVVKLNKYGDEVSEDQ